MREEAERLKERTMRFALDYRASCRARSHTEFAAKIGVVAEEADESQGWLEFIEAAKLIVSAEVTHLVGESGELVAIFSASSGQLGTISEAALRSTRSAEAINSPIHQFNYPITRLSNYPIQKRVTATIAPASTTS